MSIKKIFNNKKIFYPVIFVFFIISIVFRFYGVITKSFPFTYDIGRDLIAAREIATLQDFTLIGPTTGVEGLFYGPSWYYILAAVYHPLFGNPTLITGFIVLTGVLTFITAYILGSRVSGRFFALAWAGLLAFSPEVINLSRQIWSPDLIPVFWILSFVVLVNFFSRKKMGLNLFLLGVICSLIVDLEIVVGVLYTLGISLSILLIGRNLLTIKNILLGISGFILILLPRILFDIRHEFLLSKSFIQAIRGLVIEHNTAEPVTSFSQKVNILFSTWSKTIALENSMLGGAMLIIVIVLTFVLFKRAGYIIKKLLLVTLITLSVSAVGIILMGHSIWDHYLVIFPLLFVTWVAIILSIGFTLKKYRYFFAISALIIIIFNMNIPQKLNEYTSPLWEGDAATYRNQLAAVDYVYEESGDRSFKYIVYTPAVHDYPYRYLFSWYGEHSYDKLPDEDDAELLFVILEPDHEQPQRLRDWLKIRKNDGEIVEKETLKGGIIVQKRNL